MLTRLMLLLLLLVAPAFAQNAPSTVKRAMPVPLVRPGIQETMQKLELLKQQHRELSEKQQRELPKLIKKRQNDLKANPPNKAKQ